MLVHISNRYIELKPVVAAEAKLNGWVAALRHDGPTEKMVSRGARPSVWIALSRDPQKLAHLTGKLDTKKSAFYDGDQWLELPAPDDTRAWTDDYASVLPHLMFWKKE